MSNRDSFIARWSRRKRASTQSEEAPRSAAQSAAPDKVSPQPRAVPDPGEKTSEVCAPELAFDLAKLPPIESITAGSDIRCFLAPGVPTELARAALRRAWAADPHIRDFVGLAENQWDFNAPDGIPGFGSLPMSDELRRQVARLLECSPDTEESKRAGSPLIEQPEEQASAQLSAQSGTAAAAQPVHARDNTTAIAAAEAAACDNEALSSASAHPHANVPVATQHPSEKRDDVPSIAKRHGRALPQ